MNLLNIIEALDQKYFEVHIAYSGAGELEESLQQKKIALFKFAEHRHKIKSWASVGTIGRLCQYILSHKINIVHTHSFNTHVWGSLAAKVTGAKVVEHVHDPRYEAKEFLQERGLPLTNQFNQALWFGKLSDAIIVLTENNRSYLLNNRIAALSKIRMFLNGIPLNRSPLANKDDLLKRFTVPENSKIILTAMRLSEEKNAGFILEIARRIEDKQTFFLVAGDGPQKEELEKRAVQLNLQDKIKFIGFYPHVRDLLGLSHVFILPTLRELHSLSMTEAMSMNVPVLVSQNTGCNDSFITHAENGFVLDPRNPKPWALTIKKLLEDEMLRQRVGQAGRKLAERECDITKTVKKIEELYIELIHK